MNHINLSDKVIDLQLAMFNLPRSFIDDHNLDWCKLKTPTEEQTKKFIKDAMHLIRKETGWKLKECRRELQWLMSLYYWQAD